MSLLQLTQMSDDSSERYAELKSKFVAAAKRIIKENLSTNPEKLAEYERDIVAAHDNIIKFVSSFIINLNEQDTENFRKELVYIRDRTIACFAKLNLNAEISKDLLQVINTESTAEIDREKSKQNVEKIQVNKEKQVEKNQKENSDKSDHSDESDYHDQDDMAPMTIVDFLSFAARTVNHNYTGDPLALNAFINSIELVKEVATPELKPAFIKFVKSRLEGIALESVPEVVNNVDDIINALRQHIKPDNSKVIAGRMLALRVDRSKMVEFTQQAETLSEALQRSLIIEGISQAKAREMTIEKAVEVCRNAAKSDLVKAVLAATPFDSAKEVIAKYVVESATEYKEKQILAFKQNQRRGNNSRGRNYKNGKNYQNNRNSNGYGNSNGQNGNGKNNGRGNYRGRSNGKGRGG